MPHHPPVTDMGQMCGMAFRLNLSFIPILTKLLYISLCRIMNLLVVQFAMVIEENQRHG